MIETKQDLLQDLHLPADAVYASLEAMVQGESAYLRDLRINLKNTLQSANLSLKEAYLLALAIAVNEKNAPLRESFTKLAAENGATEAEVAEIHACTSLLSVNNVFYRFRHFMKKESYQSKPAGIKMNIMVRPVMGKEFFELVSLAVSAVNGCEACVNSHEQSVLGHGAGEDRVFDTVRLAAVVKGLCTVIN